MQIYRAWAMLPHNQLRNPKTKLFAPCRDNEQNSHSGLSLCPPIEVLFYSRRLKRSDSAQPSNSGKSGAIRLKALACQ